MKAESTNIQDYIKRTDVIDYDNELILSKCHELENGTIDEIDLIKKIYEFVRDEISHSGDIGAQEVTYKASEVLGSGHGICCAKSHLLAALLRSFSIPTGFCYQNLCSDNDADRKVLHGLNAVYLKDFGIWIRLDARGNKEGVDAQFSTHEEKIAWPINKELGEEDNELIYTDPNSTVIEVMRRSKDRDELWTYWELCLKDLFDT
ncbi:transglutaminase-like domain-containing protein [uncultured Methanomethylovorans sp.]|uniref:transglutaminase-like domain-containing protein n=1 Tax=uncultured Methanomethylovorans sp. TaxID=183759 RepID=UPI002AA6C65F|nr:transglutaminase-like domain-containing protein [uncultured Methanomethylovorans sp.]